MWGVARVRRAPEDIRARLAGDGYDIVQMQHRWFRQGPQLDDEVGDRVSPDGARRERTSAGRMGPMGSPLVL